MTVVEKRVDSAPVEEVSTGAAWLSRAGRLIRRTGDGYPLVLLLLIWQLAAVIIDNRLFLPRVDEVAARGYDMVASGVLPGHLLISLQRALIGFLIAAIAGGLIGLLMGSARQADRFFQPLVSVTYPIPKIGLVPLFLLWLGIGEASKIAVIVAAAIYPVIINVYAGVKSIDRRLLWRARMLGASGLQRFFRVVLPATLPAYFVGLRLAMGISWILLFAAEMIASSNGLGHMIIRSQQLFDTVGVFVALSTIGIVGMLFDRLVLVASRRVCSWHFAQSGETI